MHAETKESKKRAFIKQQAAIRKKEGTSASNSSIKRKPSDKTDRQPKKPMVTVGSGGVTPTKAKLPPPSSWKGQGLNDGLRPRRRKMPRPPSRRPSICP